MSQEVASGGAEYVEAIAQKRAELERARGRAFGDLHRHHYGVIYADPAWQFEVYSRETGLDRAPHRHYDTMSLDDMAELPVSALAAPDAMLAMWVYDPMLPQALELAKAWGFRFITPLFRWLKSANGQQRLFDPGERLNFGTGYHTRGGGCEECWLFKRGAGLPVLRHDIRKEFYATIREHSRKPDEVPGWLVDLYGDVPRVELFTRTTRPGWDSWGNEVGKFAPVPDATVIDARQGGDAQRLHAKHESAVPEGQSHNHSVRP